MATEKQIAANRRNAQHSTGPLTLEGKAASSRSASVTRFLTGVEDPAEFQVLLDGLLEDFQPQSTHHNLLVTRYARQLWLSQRIARMEYAIMQSQVDEA
ncbi:MAG: hypothetical protein IPM24_03490 [Bryobacterales bacterium]|nr:hypothetical protein [Bryobacterales bacterium]